MSRELKRIVTIGPAYPYRGGIAQYGGLLIKELEQRYDVKSISFKLMYPKFLYPGKTQKDYTAKISFKSKIEYMINSINPLSYWKTAKKINKYQPDLVIVHWWHPFFAFSDVGILKLLNKDIRVCICCNNVLPHDKFPMASFLTKCVLRCGDMYLIHSEEEEKILLDLIENDVCRARIFCPDVSTFAKTGMTKQEARQTFGLGEQDQVLLFFGFVRKYKGFNHLLNIMPTLIQKLPNIKLLVAGDFYDDKEKYLKQIDDAKLNDSIILYDQFIPDVDVERFFVASDLTVLPYDTATTSGVIRASYTFDRPVLVTDVGGLKEAVLEGQTGFVVEPHNEKALYKAIKGFYENESGINYISNIEKERDKYSWTRVVDAIQDMWERFHKAGRTEEG